MNELTLESIAELAKESNMTIGDYLEMLLAEIANIKLEVE